jgi:hypothetical protein
MVLRTAKRPTMASGLLSDRHGLQLMCEYGVRWNNGGWAVSKLLLSTPPRPIESSSDSLDIKD